MRKIIFLFFFLFVLGHAVANAQQKADLGINFVIEAEHQLPLVISVQPNSAGAGLQLRPYSYIHEINGISLKNKTKEEVMSLMQGPDGSDVLVKYSPEIGLLYTTTLKRTIPDPNPLYAVLPKEGTLFYPKYAGDEFQDHFKDSLILILFATKDSFKMIEGVFHKRDNFNPFSYYSSHCNVHGSFGTKISVDGHKYSTSYAFTEDSVYAWLKFQYLVHLVQASLGNGFVAELPYAFVKNPKNPRELFFSMHIKRCTPYPQWVGKNIAIDFIPFVSVENKQMYEVKMNIYLK